MIINCKICGKKVKKKPSVIKKCKNNFCSIKCVGIYNSMRVFSKGHRKKISIAMKKRKMTWGHKVSETKKMEGTCLGEKNPMYGKHHSKEMKLKISQNKERSEKISKALKGIKKPSGKESHSLNGGIRLNNGYVQIYMPNHPFSKRKCVWEHRLVVERHIGRYLTKKEVVHHINGIRTDNRIENLMLFATHREHMSFHKKIIQFGMTNQRIKEIKERWNGIVVNTKDFCIDTWEL